MEPVEREERLDIQKRLQEFQENVWDHSKDPFK
jgi:hypothetical protein